MQLRRVVVGVDGSPASAAAVHWAGEAVRQGGEVLALHATGLALLGQAAASAMTGLGLPPDLEERKDTMHRALEQWCQPLRDAGVPYRTVVCHEEPPEALLATARQEDADAIVVGHQGEQGFLHRFFESLSDNLIDHARRPVIVVPFHAPAGTSS